MNRRIYTTLHAFTLVELLVSIAIIALLMGLLVPTLAHARDAARSAKCMSNQRQLMLGWHAYANDYHDRAMPLAYTETKLIGTGDRIYWWGSDGNVSGHVDHTQGFISQYIGGHHELHDGDVCQCPCQSSDSYVRQGPTGEITSTYGYNGYYLSPRYTPGWSYSIGHRPWQTIGSVRQPSNVLVFADTLLPSVIASQPPSNNALLDPPMLYSNGTWTENQSPTTAFRHAAKSSMGVAEGAVADGSVRSFRAQPDWLTHPKQRIGSVGTDPGPHYVPDWQDW
ncbi:MAG: DUF1559 domain-containing protein [Phycisphaeraceae bacterium]|nr:DUF1559 domain-containing protein [Phycisphaerales bacterium]MCB9861239.1 DUF1559 domain-containing protein [Phycisphaeraceae bacterium]